MPEREQSPSGIFVFGSARAAADAAPRRHELCILIGAIRFGDGAASQLASAVAALAELGSLTAADVRFLWPASRRSPPKRVATFTDVRLR